MKVIHFVVDIDASSGGVSAYMQLLAKELGKLVDLVVVACRTKTPLPLENCRVRFLPRPTSEIVQFRDRWLRILREEQPDIVHVNGIWMLQPWIAQRESMRLDIPTCVTVHGMLEPWIIRRHRLLKETALLLYQQKALKKAEVLVATAEVEKENILRLHYNPHVEVIPIGINAEDVSLKLSWQRKGKIVFLSRIHVKKGIELLMDAVSGLKRELATSQVIVAGEGNANYVDSLKAYAAKMGIDGIVRFVGSVSHEQKWDLLRDADVLVLPTFSENFGIVVAEALACGTPVITTKGAPWRDLVNWDCGWWIDRDIDHLVEAIKRFMLLNEEELERMGRNGRKLVEEKYSSKRMAAEMLDLYKRLVENVFGRAHFHMV